MRQRRSGLVNCTAMSTGNACAATIVLSDRDSPRGWAGTAGRADQICLGKDCLVASFAFPAERCVVDSARRRTMNLSELLLCCRRIVT